MAAPHARVVAQARPGRCTAPHENAKYFELSKRLLINPITPMGRTTHPMGLLLYCIRYPVKPFLALPSGFLLFRPTLSPQGLRGRSNSAQARTCALANHTFSHASITGRIRADSQKRDSRDQQPPSIRQQTPHPGQRCARTNLRAISRPSNRFLRMFAGRSANHARQAAISN